MSQETRGSAVRMLMVLSVLMGGGLAATAQNADCYPSWFTPSPYGATDGAQGLDFVFAIDCSGSMRGDGPCYSPTGPYSFYDYLEKAGTTSCVYDNGPIPYNGRVAVGLVQFAGAAVECAPLQRIRSLGDAVAFSYQVNYLNPPEAAGYGTLPETALGLAQAMLVNDGATYPYQRAVLLYTDLMNYFDYCHEGFYPAPTQNAADALRDLDPPATVCVGWTRGDCYYVTPYDEMQCWANTPECPAFDPNKPVGVARCVSDPQEVVELCAECVCLARSPLPRDCNQNHIPDACDIVAGRSLDLNQDGIPDECTQRGDCNCDGVVNAADIPAFVLAVHDTVGYATNYPNCYQLFADVNHDGVVNTADSQPFADLVAANCRHLIKVEAIAPHP